MQLVELQQVAGELDRLGVAPFAISYDAVDALGVFAAKNSIEYPLLSDQGSETIRRLGMLDEHLDQHHAEMGGTVRDDQRGVAYPGVFLLDEQGIVVQRRFQRNYRVRESGLSVLDQALNVSLPERTPTASAERAQVRVTARLDSPTYWRYQRLWATVELDIAPGCHVNASSSRDGNVPLTVEVEAADAEVGQPVLPAPHQLMFQSIGEELQVFDGTVRVAVPFEFIIQRGEPMGRRTVLAKVRWQACDATSCFPPDEAQFQFTVDERPGVE